MSKRAELRCVWGKRERGGSHVERGDFVYHYDKQKMDGHLLHCLLMYGLNGTYKEEVRSSMSSAAAIDALRADLRKRGYDPDTFTIGVRRARPPR